MDKFFKYIAEGGTEAEAQAASMEYLEGVLQNVLQDQFAILAAIKTAITDIDNGDYKAARDILKTTLREP